MTGAAVGLFAVLFQAFHTHDIARAATPDASQAAEQSGALGGDDGLVPYVSPEPSRGYRDVPVPSTYGGYGGAASAYSAAPVHTRSGPS